MGHGRNYVPSDVFCRYRRMKGDAVLHPMGWDAFGLPAENEAIKKGVHPRVTTTRYAANYRRQMTLVGCSYDWEREINSSDPDFYHWTQWFFLQLYARGLAYRARGKQWWCPGCRTVLADEQTGENHVCWRGHPGVHKRDLEQWYLCITAYAEQLLVGLEELDWPEPVLAAQRNWIGRSEGVAFQMRVEGCGACFSVFTTRPDTICGMTFAVMAPEHPLIRQITAPERRADVECYCQETEIRSEIARLSAGRDGVFTGAQAINPANGRQVPIYVADYVLSTYAGGAIMGVPAHDQRDFDFARRHQIPVLPVIAPCATGGRATAPLPFTGSGVMINSGRWDRMPSGDAKERIADWMEATRIGRRAVQYRMRDWLISRQRYWGAPIPIVHCSNCGPVAVPERELPVLLPDVSDWHPDDDGRSPLAKVPSFVGADCPACGRPARRETDTLDGFACSSWYFLRFVSPRLQHAPFDPADLAAWGAPDLYVGGAEHAVMHLLYARFWTRVMADARVVPFREPFPVLKSQGVMHARDPETGEARRMSKSAGNVVTPDSVVEAFGADALRIYLLFMAPFDHDTVWEGDGAAGARRFLERTWRLVEVVAQEGAPAAAADHSLITRLLHQTIRSVTVDVEAFRFNTAIPSLMTLLNAMSAHRRGAVTADLIEATRTFVLLLAPFAPFIAEELWERLGGPYSVHQQLWPGWDEELAAEDEITWIVQVDGRVRCRMSLPADTPEDRVQTLALEATNVSRCLAGRRVARIVLVPGRLVNIVTVGTV